MKDCLSCSDCRQWERKAASDLPWLLLSRGKKWVSSCRHPPFQDLLWPLLCAYSLWQPSLTAAWLGEGVPRVLGKFCLWEGFRGCFLRRLTCESAGWRGRMCAPEQNRARLNWFTSNSPSPPTTELWHHPSAAFRQKNSGSWGFRLCLGILPATPWCWAFHAWSSPHHQLFCITSLQFFYRAFTLHNHMSQLPR